MWKGSMGRDRSNDKWDIKGGHGRRDAPGKELGTAWGRDAYRVRRVWTGVQDGGYPGDGAVKGEELGLNSGLHSVVRGAQGWLCVHLQGISALFPIG